MKKIVAISGSTKKNSTSEKILKYITELFKETLEVEIFDSIDKLPHFNPEKTDNPPQVVEDFRNLIRTADGVIVCTPEYVFSLPGSLKNAIEWTVSTTVFSKKPVATIVAAASGEKAFESINLILTTIESILPKDSRLLIKGAKGKISDTEMNEETAEEIEKIVKSLFASIEDHEQIPTKYST